MKRRWSLASKLFVVLALAFGSSAFLVVRGYAARVEALAPALGEPVTVVVAASAIPRGTVLSEGMLEVASYPARFAPPGALEALARAIGRTVLTDLAAGEPVTRTRLSPGRAGPIAALVPPGLRAFVLATALPTGAVRPGDRVDVMATFAGGQPHTETVASGVEILAVAGSDASAEGGSLQEQAVGESGSAAPEAERSLVLLVDPDQAEQLAYARAFADLSVSVEGPGEEVSGAT
jgi:pilus assembly protein CpaB